jgi:hypothetical protein
VPRLRRHYPAAPWSAGLIAAACAVALGCGMAMAQTAAPDNPDPLAPQLQTDPSKPPRFQKFTKPEQAQLGPPPTFTEPPSAAGDTGFDATNSRKKKAKANAKKKSTLSNSVEDIPSSDAAAPAVSPYQTPFPLAGVYASAPGAPPVDIGPIRKPLAKKKAHSQPDDPYAQTGVQAGAFTLFPAVELIGGYSSNPSQSPGGKGAALYSIAPELRAQSNWSRHDLKLDLRGSYTGYSPDSEPSLNTPYLNGKADGRIDVTRMTRIDLSGRVLVSTDNPGSPNLQAGLARLPIFTTFGGNAGLGQKLNRFDLSAKADAERTVYQNSSLTDGTTASNDDRNYNQYSAILRGGYELSPGITPFVEVDADTRKHDLTTDFSGYQRDSNGLTGKAGTTFEISRLLTGEIALGYTKRNYQDPRLDQLSGLIGDASLIWTANALTTVSLKASSSVGESTVAGVAGILYRSADLQVDHAFRRWLIGSVKLGFGLDTYLGSDAASSGGSAPPLCTCVVSTPGGTMPDRVDTRYSAGVGLTYKFNRFAQIKGEFRQDWVHSNVSGVDYTASIFMLGLRFQQ